MKEIKAFIRINMIDYVIDALEAMEHPPGITLSDVRGWGHVKGDKKAQLLQRVKLETVVPTQRADEIISIIADKGHTGRPGDGKIFVSNVERGIRIRTGETNEDVVR